MLPQPALFLLKTKSSLPERKCKNKTRIRRLQIENREGEVSTSGSSFSDGNRWSFHRYLIAEIFVSSSTMMVLEKMRSFQLGYDLFGSNWCFRFYGIWWFFFILFFIGFLCEGMESDDEMRRESEPAGSSSSGGDISGSDRVQALGELGQGRRASGSAEMEHKRLKRQGNPGSSLSPWPALISPVEG